MTTPTSIARTSSRTPIPRPKVKFSRNRVLIDHPDLALLAEAFGHVDCDALHGLLGQLARASLVAGKLDQNNLSFMISMVKSLAPRDPVEAMLVVQMVSIQLATMRSASRLAMTGNVQYQESLSRVLTRLARTFTAQMDALNRHRNSDACAITVQTLSVQEGGRAVVGNITQHANLIAASGVEGLEAADLFEETSDDARERVHAGPIA